MRKGIGPFSIIVIGIIGSLVISGTYLFAFYGRSTVSKRAMIEVNVIDAINKIELKKISLSKALKYSFYQVSYILSKFGGYSDLSDQSIVKSYECIPYWREYPVLSYPGFSYIEETTAQFLSTYSKSMNDESSNPIYESVAVKKNKFDQTEVFASGQDITVDRDKIDVKVSSFLNQTLDDRIAKMYSDAERIFIINDGIKTAVEAAIEKIPEECKNINIGDKCENEIPTSEFVLNDKCPNWNQIVRETVFLQINEFNRYSGLSVSVENPEEDVFITFKGECSGNNIGESSSCRCKKSTSVDCGGYSSSGCDDFQKNNGCQNCYYPDGLYKGCFCGGCSSTKCSKCEEHYGKIEGITCNYDYYISVNVLVEMIDNSDSEYLVYEDETSRFDKVKLDFRILSGNVYEDITDKLSNPSFEGGWSDVGPSKQQPNGWSLTWTSSPECRHMSKDFLPKDEWLGGLKALILDQEWTYKIFQGGSPFSAALTQRISGLEPNTKVVLVAPIQVHTQGNAGIEEAKIKLTLGSEEKEFKGRDRAWIYTSILGEVEDGNDYIDLSINVESTSLAGIDFFIDNLKLYKITADEILEAKTNPCVKEIIEIPKPVTPEPQGNLEEYIYMKSDGQSPLIGLSDCIFDAASTSKIPEVVFYAIPIQEGGNNWKGSNLQKGLCSVDLGNPSGKQSNNLYSIKGSGCSWGTWECYAEKSADNCIAPNEDGYKEDCNGLYYCVITDSFKSYPTKCDSVNDFVDKITTSSRYKDCPKDDAKKFVQCLKDNGYATDPTWSTKVGKIIDELQPYIV